MGKGKLNILLISPKGEFLCKNPDFAAYARAFGGFGVTVDKTADFAPAYEAAVASGKPAIIHLKVDPSAITPVSTIEGIREKALSGK